MAVRIKNWDDFQHYKGRTPPWIKLYRKLLDDPEWFALSGDASKMLANCWLLASEHDGELPDLATIAFRLRMSEKRAAELISQLSHWLEGNASMMLAPCKQDACLETERETDKNIVQKPKVKQSGPDPSFSEFYSAYPRRQSKQDAIKAYAKVRRSGVSHETIMRGLEAAKRSDSRFREQRFTPLPASWLRAGGFEDDTTSATSHQSLERMLLA